MNTSGMRVCTTLQSIPIDPSPISVSLSEYGAPLNKELAVAGEDGGDGFEKVHICRTFQELEELGLWDLASSSFQFGK